MKYSTELAEGFLMGTRLPIPNGCLGKGKEGSVGVFSESGTAQQPLLKLLLISHQRRGQHLDVITLTF